MKMTGNASDRLSYACGALTIKVADSTGLTVVCIDFRSINIHLRSTVLFSGQLY